MSSVPPPNWQPPAAPRSESPEPQARPAPNRRARPRVIGALVAAGLLTGGGFLLFGSSATKVNDPVAQAATLSASAGGYRMQMAISVSSPSLGAPFTGTGEGIVDARDHAAAITMSMNLGNIPQVTQALGGSALRITELVDGTTVYMKLPAVVTGLLGSPGKPWLRLDVAKSFHLPGLASIGSNPAMGDPSQMLQYLRAVADSVAAEGHQRVDGFEATRYHADISLDRVVSSLPSADRAVAHQAISALEQGSGLRTIPVDVWVDRQHLVRRMSMAMSLPLPGSQPMSLGMTMDYSDYGPQPRPAPPPADQVQDFGGLASGLSGG